MRISGLRVTPVDVPLEAPLWWAGELYPGTAKFVIEVETDTGLLGPGEAPSTVVAMGEKLVGFDLAGND
jgi:glucarate dehydratase